MEKGIARHHDERDFTKTPVEPQFHIGVNDFDFIRVIGRGSYAKVMMVRLKETERIYAMKVSPKIQFVSLGYNVMSQPVFHESFN